MKFIDWDRLMSLRHDIGEEDFADVAFVFFSEMDGKLLELLEDPTRRTADDFHFLRGSAANLGFVAMAEACETAEAACREGRVPDLDDVTGSFRGALAEVQPRLPELDGASAFAA
ncbi:Hpt domain-containing protein [Roseibacterium sp. SDUM158017]|uniref:Hpt domain-containing protein n=1 Tax=Roseicyclus salinarum TaxID=3036773 RepID=UPI0024154874|nr:Hpt domain-containing protein [Roseibacterium sp. SDUM158017]MDG4646879.1 Hpt domain-containing protein [Roseibacterium sp. SDUM158017]